MTNLPSNSQVAKKTASFIVSCLANPGLHVPHDVTLLSCFYLGPFLNCQHPPRHLHLQCWRKGPSWQLQSLSFPCGSPQSHSRHHIITFPLRTDRIQSISKLISGRSPHSLLLIRNRLKANMPASSAPSAISIVKPKPIKNPWCSETCSCCGCSETCSCVVMWVGPWMWILSEAWKIRRGIWQGGRNVNGEIAI